MTHTYKVSGMTCSGCQTKVQSLLTKIPGVNTVSIDLGKGEVRIDMDQHIATAALIAVLKDYPQYQLAEMQQKPPVPDFAEPEKSWMETYRPILLIFAYLLGLTFVPGIANGDSGWMRWMSRFMAGFFLTFSFFKLLNLKGFAETYAMYDIIAKKWNRWGYVYAFIELVLGIAFLTGFNPVITNAATFAVMSLSITGVLRSVMNKRNISCACLGAVFNLPMSTVTVIEDLLMIIMSGIMLISIL